MASASPLLDIEENFFICPICLDYFREPKSLPCLHRFCRTCLQGIIEEKHGAFECPMCNHPCTATSEGVEEFKTDFHMKSLLEFIQLQRTLEQKDGRECIGCSKKKTVEAYCFECEDFLCDQCYQFHITNRMFSKHLNHVLNVKNIGEQGLTLEKLASLTGAPRCTTHAEHVAQMLCNTCGKVPICVACTLGKHKSHEFYEVTTLATAQREDLVQKMEELQKLKDKLYELPQNIEIFKRKLEENVSKEKERLKSQKEQRVAKIKNDFEKNDEVLEKRKLEFTRKKQEECRRVRMDYENRIDQLKREYAKTLQDTERKYDGEAQRAEEEHGKIRAELVSGRGEVEGDFNDSIDVIDKQVAQKEQEIREISERSSHTINRYENVTATSSAVLAAKDDWLEAQCIPDIGAAFEPLMADVKKELSALASLSDIPPRRVPEVVDERVIVTDREISVIDFKGGRGWYNLDLTTCGDDGIVVTNKAHDKYSYITVLNTDGKILRQKKIRGEKGSRSSWRFCSRLTQFKIATVMQYTEIGIYDIRDGTYIQTDFRFSGQVSCITIDPVNKNILVGCYESSSVEVFDDKLNHLHELVLPYTPNSLLDINMCERTLLVCESIGERAYAANTTGKNVKLLQEFTKPYKDKNCRPWSVSSDSSGFCYILWSVSGISRRIVAQYSRYGQHLLTTRQVDSDARRVRVLKDKEGEKLLVLTESRGKVYVYGLNTANHNTS